MSGMIERFFPPLSQPVLSAARAMAGATSPSSGPARSGLDHIESLVAQAQLLKITALLNGQSYAEPVSAHWGRVRHHDSIPAALIREVHNGSAIDQQAHHSGTSPLAEGGYLVFGMNHRLPGTFTLCSPVSDPNLERDLRRLSSLCVYSSEDDRFLSEVFVRVSVLRGISLLEGVAQAPLDGVETIPLLCLPLDGGHHGYSLQICSEEARGRLAGYNDAEFAKVSLIQV